MTRLAIEQNTNSQDTQNTGTSISSANVATKGDAGLLGAPQIQHGEI